MENTDQVVEAIADALEQGLEGIVEGAKEDVRAWAVLMGSQATEAAAVGDQVTLDSLARQSRMLAEKNRIRAQEASWNMISQVVGAVLNLAVRVAA